MWISGQRWVTRLRSTSISFWLIYLLSSAPLQPIMAALLFSAIGKRFSHLPSGFSFWLSGHLASWLGDRAFELAAAIYYHPGTCCLIAKATRNDTSPFRWEMTMMRLHWEKKQVFYTRYLIWVNIIFWVSIFAIWNLYFTHRNILIINNFFAFFIYF